MIDSAGLRFFKPLQNDVDLLLRFKYVLIYGYDYEAWPMDRAIEAFELLARQHVRLGPRVVAGANTLVHPVHRTSRVFGWEIGPNAG